MTSSTYLPPHAPARPGTDALAIVGFVTSLLLPPVGAAISLVALSRLRASGAPGRGLAIAGLVVGAVGTAIGLAVLLMVGTAVSVFQGQKDEGIAASLRADLRSAALEMETRAISEGTYPADDAALGFLPSSYGNEVQVLYGDADGFCLVGTAEGTGALYLDEQGVTSTESCV